MVSTEEESQNSSENPLTNRKRPALNSSCVTVATCNLNQWALDFNGNLDRTLQSCMEAKRLGASYRLGPELELCGYGCEDHFFESDTFDHCWESLSSLFDRGGTDGLLCDVGMPILHGGARYNCRVLCRDRRILLIRPKVALADNGNYRESRYFTAYRRPSSSGGGDVHRLPSWFVTKHKDHPPACPFGVCYIRTSDGAMVGCESCEELWTPNATNIDMALAGVEIIGNGSGSHHELRKLDARLELMVSATRKCGGVYLYSNQRGCDGSRLYYDGCSMIVCNGTVLAQAEQFDVRDVQVISATIDLDDVRSYRASIPSYGVQIAERSATQPPPADVFAAQSTTGSVVSTGKMVVCDWFSLSANNNKSAIPAILSLGPVNTVRIHTPEEECCLGPACWLWDYLRRSGASGFFLPLSGGADSSAVATIVGAMCEMVTTAARADPDGEVASECRRVCRMTNNNNNDPKWVPANAKDMANRIMHTTFMGTENSSEATLSRALRLSEAIGSYHVSLTIDRMVDAVLAVFQLSTGRMPKFVSQGGTATEDLALQNIQARLRMVTAYLFAQLLPWVRGSKSGFLLVLGTANVDEGLRGYMTKYDCSSADLNPIGAISKNDLKRMLLWAEKRYGYTILKEIAGAPPSAELRPMVSSSSSSNDDESLAGQAEHSQTDEEDMGMTYEELGLFGRLRKISRCGPVSMFRKLCIIWNDIPVSIVAEKVKRFFYYYSINRHKMCTVTPAYHAEGYSPDDNRFDLRQFLYNSRWTRQFAVIDEVVESTIDQNDDSKKES